VVLPDQKFGFAVLANWDYTPLAGFIGGIMDIYFPRPPRPAPAPPAPSAKPVPPVKAVKVKTDVLDSYIGDYRFGPGSILSIGREGNSLTVIASGTKFVLTTVSETEFRLDAVSASIKFRPDESGKVNRLVWNQGTADRSALKVLIVKPTPEQLREYAGVYENEEIGLRFGLALSGDALVVTAAGQAPVRLAPEEKDRFTSNSRIAPMIAFQRDGQGRVTGFIIESEQVRDLVFRLR
jgi:hypothetical protein